MDRALNLVLDHPLHCCSSCTHWSQAHKAIVDDYLVAACMQPPDPRDHEFKRGSDKCQHWKGA